MTVLTSRTILLSLPLVLFFLTHTVSAQVGTATLEGTVRDESGEGVRAAEVRLLFDDGRVEVRTTDEGGGYSFDVVGRFELEVFHPGFRSLRSTPVSLSPGVPYEIDIILLAGDPAEVERVELLLDDEVDLPGSSGPLAREDLPRPDRLFGLRGGINVSGIAEGSSQEWIAASGTVFASSPSTTVLVQPLDFSAEVPTNVGVDDSLPPGGPSLNGNAYYFHRNDGLNARNFFDPPAEPIPPFKYHFFGGELGGRVREGTFVFARYWGLRIRQSITRAATVPDPAEVRGDFSALSVPILDPQVGFPFPGNIIPPDRIHPLGQALVDLFPAPNVTGTEVQNYRSVGSLVTLADAFGVRVDHRTSVADETSFEYQHNRDTTDDPFNLVTGITNLPGFGVRDGLVTQTLRVANAHVFDSSLLHQARFSFGFLHQPRRIQSEQHFPAAIVTGFSNIGHATNLPQERRNKTTELSSDVSWVHGSRTTKVGGAVRHFSFDAFMALYSRGQFQFTGGSFSNNALANLLLGVPANALRIEGDTNRKFRTWMSGIYVQHEWRVRPTLALSAGVRYDFQAPFTEADGRVANFQMDSGLVTSPEQLYAPDRNNWGPRLGVAWSPLTDTVIRAGYGIFYDNLVVGDSLFLLGLNPPFVQFDVEDNDPVLPRFDLGTVFLNPSGTVPPSIFSAEQNLSNPYIQQWSFQIDRTLWQNYDVNIGYVGQKGTRLRRQVNLNQPLPGTSGSLDERRPFEGFRNIFQFETSASSSGHALDVGLVRRFRMGFGLRLDYRLSRIIDDATLISILPQNSHDLGSERGLADFHAKNRFSFSGTYNLPFVDGWQAQAIGTFRSGMPISAILGTDVAGTGSPIVNRPDMVGNPHVDNPTPARFFNTEAFEVPEFGQFGNSGRNVIIGPGLANVDLALSHVFRVSDRLRAQFRLDAYNAFNRPNFVAPPTTQNFADSPEFGALFVARSPRVVQLGLRMFW